MSSTRNLAPVHIGLVSDEPIRLEGLFSIFDQPAEAGRAPLLPITGSLAEMLAPDDVVWVHDYHLMQVGAALRPASSTSS